MYDGDVIINQDGRLSGVVTGDVIVRPGCTVGISGTIAGDVYVEAGAYARISGMVSGRIAKLGSATRVGG
jgi:cytoskeletal protein CcmA (bactofilin family)